MDQKRTRIDRRSERVRRSYCFHFKCIRAPQGICMLDVNFHGITSIFSFSLFLLVHFLYTLHVSAPTFLFIGHYHHHRQYQ